MSHRLNGIARGFGLGSDFWLFQAGQMISIVGDACGNIALAWWILDVTASPTAISAGTGSRHGRADHPDTDPWPVWRSVSPGSD